MTDKMSRAYQTAGDHVVASLLVMTDNVSLRIPLAGCGNLHTTSNNERSLRRYTSRDDK